MTGSAIPGEAAQVETMDIATVVELYEMLSSAWEDR